MATLEFTTDNAEPAHVLKVDGVPYPFIDSEDLPLLHWARIRRLLNRTVELTKLEDPSEEQLAEADQVNDKTVRAIVPALPEDVFKKLKNRQKTEIIHAFFRALGAARGDQTAQQSSPSSSASTGDIPVAG